MAIGESLPAQQLMLTRFRGKYAEAVVVNSATELRDQAELLRSGLKQLEDTLNLATDAIDYSGFGLIYYPEPTEDFAFTNPDAARGLIGALKAAGLDIPDDPGEMDDYSVRRDSCLDFKKQGDCYWPTSGLLRAAFLLAPVVREVGWGYGWDEFKQDPKMHVRHASAVRIPGIVLLEGLLQHDPNLDEDRVPSAAMAYYIDTIVSTES